MSKTPEQDVIEACPTCGKVTGPLEYYEPTQYLIGCECWADWFLTRAQAIAVWKHRLAHSKPTSEGEQSLGQEGEAVILKGTGKINGDGWKDTTKKGEIVFAWNAELPPPYSAGQYPRVGNEIWSASTDQYDFVPATLDEVRELFAALTPAQAEPVAERAAIVAWLRDPTNHRHPDFAFAAVFADKIEQGLHHRAQALADLAEGGAELIGEPKAG